MRVFLAFLLLINLLIFPAVALDQKTTERIATSFAKLTLPKDKFLWNYQLTPLFPTAWPPKKEGKAVCYAFAYGYNPAAGSFSVVARPWAKIIVHANASVGPEIVLLSSSLEPLSQYQGVKPLQGQENQLLSPDNQNKIESALLLLTTTKGIKTNTGKEVRSYFKVWFKYNGVISAELRSENQRFFKWVGY